MDLLTPQGDLPIDEQVGIAQIGAEHRVVILRHRTQQQWPRFFEQQRQLRQNAGIPVIQPFGTAGLRADVAAVIEHGEGVAVL